MKKEGIIAIVLLTVVFSSLFVSANIFTDFWGKITGKAIDTPPIGMIPAPTDPVVFSLGCTVNVSACQGTYPEQVMKGSVYVLTGSISEKYCLLSAYPELGEDYRSWPFQGTCAEVKELLDGFCYDSDFGNSAYVAGTTTSSSRDFLKETKQDKCENTESLREYYCVPYNVENCRTITGCIRSELITCPNQCSQGACIKTKSDTLKTCTELKGKVCQEGEVCSIALIDSSEGTGKCCTGTCDVPTKTCTELQGKVCDEGYRCKENFAESSDEEACCTAECEVIPSNLGKTCAEIPGRICEEGYKCPANDFAIAKDTSECCLKECELIIVDDKCPFSNRQSGKYCAADGKYYSQLEDDSACENNFECQGNLCISGECVSSSFMEKVFDWFRRLFGIDKIKNNNGNDEPPEEKTCSELKGKVCEKGYKCKEEFTESSDEKSCCTAGCEKIPSNLGKTCIELNGKVCEENEECSKNIELDSEDKECCLGECKTIVPNSEISGALTCNPLDYSRISLDYNYDSDTASKEVTLFRGTQSVSLLPPRVGQKTLDNEVEVYKQEVAKSIQDTYAKNGGLPPCMEGWKNYQSWSTTVSRKVQSSIFCSGDAACNTQYHDWANKAPESCQTKPNGLCKIVVGYAKTTQVGCVPSGNGNYINTGLNELTEYTYYLRNGKNPDSPLIAQATCTTKRAYEETTPTKTIQCTENSNCEKGKYCDSDNQCIPCNCGEKECGTDQCGDPCGDQWGGCTNGETCNIFGQCGDCLIGQDCYNKYNPEYSYAADKNQDYICKDFRCEEVQCIEAFPKSCADYPDKPVCKDTTCVECRNNGDCETEKGYYCRSSSAYTDTRYTCSNRCSLDETCPWGFECIKNDTNLIIGTCTKKA